MAKCDPNLLPDALKGREIIIEYAVIGNIAKVTALDAKSYQEAVIQGPVSYSQRVLTQNALRKLTYILKKNGLIKG